MNVEQITSRRNVLMTHIRKLGSSRAYRMEHGEYLCDGIKMLQEAIQWHAPIRTAIFTDDVEIPALPEGVRTVRVDRELMRSISPMETPQGALFTVALPESAPLQRLTGRHYLVLDGVQDPGNVGTILRTADAFCCDGVLLVNACADAFHPKTVRATMGAIFRTSVRSCTVEELAALLRESSLPLYGTALRHDTATLGAVDLSRAAVAIGSEGKGLSEQVLAQCEKTIKIPMSERCESLNAAIAAAVVLWEMYR